MPTSAEREGLIHLDVASRDQEGRRFGDLKPTDMTLLQDGTATKIMSFHGSNQGDQDERLSEVCLVLDEVDLSPEQFVLVKNEMVSFLRRELAQPVSILWIKTDGVYASAFPTDNGNTLADDITSNHVIPTQWKFHPEQQLGIAPRDAVWDGVLRTVYALAVKWKDKPGRKALVWIGYGWSILGKLDATGGPFPVLVELATRIREARMVIYDITPWPDPEIPVYGKTPAIDYHRFLSLVRSSSDPALKSPVPYFALPVLAVQSGGLVLDNSHDLAADIGSSIADAGDFYTVSFDPPHAVQPDEYHDLAVLTGTSQLQMRTSHGYYDQPVFYDEPRVAERRLNVAELQQALDSDRNAHDLAKKLNGLELTERLTTPPLSSWTEGLHGKEAKAALTVLGDNSVFLAPPAAEIPDQPAPDDTLQHQIILRTEKYLDEVVTTLPDFSADATTVKYEQPSPGNKDSWKAAPLNHSLMQTVSEQTTLLYRNGREQQVLEKVAGKRVAGRNDLNYTGIFGPILRFVLDDVRRGNSKLIWARWEQTGHGKLAVFRYSVRGENPRYGVVYCCLVDGSRIETLPGRHGELAIDPDTGAILRITVESEPGWTRETDLNPLRSVLFSNMMVEYGPVNIGGRTFICPKRSVAITRERTVRPVNFWGLNFAVYGPYQTLMNDTAYRNYHKFGSESRMLPGFEVVQDGKGPTSPGQTEHSRSEAEIDGLPDVSKAVLEKAGTPQAIAVADLAEIVEASKGKRDGDVAKRIEHSQLTERLSSPEFARLSEELPGAKSKAALMAVGDASVFLEPPKSEMPDKAAPDTTEQRQIVSRAADYLKRIVPELPDFYAKRSTASFLEVWTPKDKKASHKPDVLHPAGKFTATVLYRDGKEDVRAEGTKERGLITQGTFGPILSAVIADSSQGPMQWRGWENGPNGPIAVFQFEVPQVRSHYRISFASAMSAVPAGGASTPTLLTSSSDLPAELAPQVRLGPSELDSQGQVMAYHGEIGIDPGTGTILRLVVRADPEANSPMGQADIMVEYESVVIGGKVYTCPAWAVSMATGELRQEVMHCLAGCRPEGREIAFILLDDVVFSDYQVLGSEAHR